MHAQAKRLLAIPLAALLITSACGGEGSSSSDSGASPEAPQPQRAQRHAGSETACKAFWVLLEDMQDGTLFDEFAVLARLREIEDMARTGTLGVSNAAKDMLDTGRAGDEEAFRDAFFFMATSCEDAGWPNN